jgi:hypothetical protein
LKIWKNIAGACGHLTSKRMAQWSCEVHEVVDVKGRCSLALVCGSFTNGENCGAQHLAHDWAILIGVTGFWRNLTTYTADKTLAGFEENSD